MADPLKTMLVNPGDPITSELLTNIVSNINLINSMARSSAVDPSNPGGGGTQVIESNRSEVPVNTASTGKLAIKFKKTFTSKPNVVCTIEQSVPKQFTTDRYMPVITSVSQTGFTVQMLSLGATTTGNIWVQWIAVSP